MKTPKTIPHSGPCLEKVGASEVIDCAECGYAHVRPMPSVGDLKRLYTEKFYAEDKADYLIRMEQDLAWWNMVYEERYAVIERLLGTRKNRRMLDIGCSGGWFLTAGQKRGWTVRGIEMSRQAAAYAVRRGIPAVQGDIQDVDLSGEEAFDAVHLSFVLEHLPNPLEILRKIKALMAPGGILCLDVPNDFNPLQAVVRKALGARPYWVVPDHHLNYFTPETLSALARKAGFESRELEGSFPMELFLLMGDDYVGNDPLGRQLHGKRKRLETLLHENGLGGFKSELYRFLIQKRVGREVILYARNVSGER